MMIEADKLGSEVVIEMQPGQNRLSITTGYGPDISAWPTNLVVTVQQSNDLNASVWQAVSDPASTFTAKGTIEGLVADSRYVRAIVTTVGTSAGEITVDAYTYTEHL